MREQTEAQAAVVKVLDELARELHAASQNVGSPLKAEGIRESARRVMKLRDQVMWGRKEV